MTAPVVVIGLGAEGLEGLRSNALKAVQAATFLAGGRRHLELVGSTSAETFTITDNIDALIARLGRRGDQERCVVLASGDPLFYGIGDRIIAALGREQVQVETSVSSMQYAFARAGLSWHDAAIASIHGRPLKPVLLPLLGRPRIGLFTRDGASPSEVARFLDDHGLAREYHAWVCSDLNSDQELVTSAPLIDLIGRSFSRLNVLVLERRGKAFLNSIEPADDAFAQPESGAILLTHQDIRALVLRRFGGLVDGPIWDLGAGLGGVSVELARAFPGREIVAVERAATQLVYLKMNRIRFEVFNIRIVENEAPGCLTAEESPSGVFLGGSGGHLTAILDVVASRLLPGGQFVANFVGIENLAAVLERFRTIGWPMDVIQAQIAEGRPLAGLTTLVPQRPVWIVSATKP